jgi:NADPH:quinone reductase-like Zn-dependent oxidoreductase
VNLIDHGMQVCALLSGGGYAEKVAVPAGQVLPVPQGVSLKDAAGLPEVACAVWSTVFMMSRLSAGETFLVISKETFFFYFFYLFFFTFLVFDC